MAEVSYRFDTYDKDNPMLVILIEGYEYQFSVASVAEDYRQWMAEIVTGHLKVAFTRGKRIGMTEVQDQFKQALGIK